MRRPRWLNLDAVATAIIVLSLVALLVITVVFPYVTRRVNQVQLEVACQVANSNRDQLQALRAIGLELGIPIEFTVPPRLPPECDIP